MLQKISPFIIITLLYLTACRDDQIHRQNNLTKVVPGDTIEIVSTVDRFSDAVQELKSIHYYVWGKDSIRNSTDPNQFIELNGIKSCFINSFDIRDDDIAFYKLPISLKKYHVAKDMKHYGPSATLIELTFEDSASAQRWLQHIISNKNFDVIKAKPKKEIWYHKGKVYFVQSYYDPDGNVLKTVMKKFKLSLN